MCFVLQTLAVSGFNKHPSYKASEGDRRGTEDREMFHAADLIQTRMSHCGLYLWFLETELTSIPLKAPLR